MLLTFLIPAFNSKGIFTQPVGTTFTYDCLKNELSVSVDENSTDIAGFSLEDKIYEPNTKVTVEVTKDFPYTYNVTSPDGKEESYVIETTDTNNFLLGGPFKPFNILATLTPIYSDPFYNESKLDVYKQPICIPPFIDVNPSIWENLEYYIPLNVDLYTNNNYFGMTIDYFMERNDDFIIINSRMYGNIEPNSTSQDIVLDLDYSFICVYENETGILQGLRMFSATSGIFRGHDVRLDIDIHVEIENYDLPYSITTPGYNWLITILSIFAIALIPLITKKVGVIKY